MRSSLSSSDFECLLTQSRGKPLCTHPELCRMAQCGQHRSFVVAEQLLHPAFRMKLREREMGSVNVSLDRHADSTPATVSRPTQTSQ